MTSGSDGSYYTWNKDFKAKYHTMKNSQMPVTVGSFNQDGHILAWATGEDYTMGCEGAQTR